MHEEEGIGWNWPLSPFQVGLIARCVRGKAMPLELRYRKR